MRKVNLEQYRERIKEMYFSEMFSVRKIAEEIGVCMGTVRKNMVLWNLERRPTRKRELKKPSKEKLEKIYYDQNKPIEEILKELGIGLTTFFRWLKEDNINPKRRWKYDKTNFSSNVKEKAYILGLVAGDLYIHKHYQQILTELSTTHPAMVELFYSVFQKYGTPKKYIKYNKKTKRYGWGVYVLLNSSFEFMLSNNFEIDNEEFYVFLAGFFDCEGCFYVYNNSRKVWLTWLIYNSNTELLKTIKKRLEKDGFHPKLNKCSEKGEKTTNGYSRGVDVWSLGLYSKGEVLRIMNILPIRHKEKLDKFEIVKSAKEEGWEIISERLANLKNKIRSDVQDFIKPIDSN